MTWMWACGKSTSATGRRMASHPRTPSTRARTPAGAALFRDFYARAVKRYGYGQRALLAAVSAYNTGNFQAGFKNGYVARVVAATQMNTGD